MTARTERLVTSGTFEPGGGRWEVDNKVWLIGNDNEVIAVGDRRLVADVCTHSRNDHVNAAPALAARYGAPILLHPADAVLW